MATYQQQIEAEQLGLLNGGLSASGLFDWLPYEPSTAADTYPARRPVGAMVPEDGDYELELIGDDGEPITVTVTLKAGAPYEIANLSRVRSGAEIVILTCIRK
jgi:hypothetical protein